MKERDNAGKFLKIEWNVSVASISNGLFTATYPVDDIYCTVLYMCLYNVQVAFAVVGAICTCLLWLKVLFFSWIYVFHALVFRWLCVHNCIFCLLFHLNSDVMNIQNNIDKNFFFFCLFHWIYTDTPNTFIWVYFIQMPMNIHTNRVCK